MPHTIPESWSSTALGRIDSTGACRLHELFPSFLPIMAWGVAPFAGL